MQDQWMKNEAGREIRVDQSQVAAFKKQGFEVFDRPPDPEPEVSRQSGNQANMGRTVQMERGNRKIRAEKAQVDEMKKAGWEVSEVQPEMPKPKPALDRARSKDPVHGVVRMVRETEDGCEECTADAAQVPALEAAGWVNPEKAAAPAPAEGEGGEGATMSSEMHLSIPGMIVKEQPFDAHVDQQLQGVSAGAAGVQFSDGPPNPDDPEDLWQWTTARPPGGGGIIEAAAVPFDARDTSWDYPGIVAHGSAFMRVGAWPDQGLTGPPVVASNAVEVKPKTRTVGLAPDELGDAPGEE